MPLILNPIRYARLTARQKENYNFAKLAAALADYGFVTMRLSDDWQGADCIAQHFDGTTILRIQLKGRLAFHKKYAGKDLFIAFFAEGAWYLVPHDEALRQVLEVTGIGKTLSWSERGGYSFPSLSRQLREVMRRYRVELVANQAIEAATESTSNEPAIDGQMH